MKEDEAMTVIHHNGAFVDSPERPELSEPLLTADDAAELLRVRRSTVYELARTRRLPHVRVGRRILFVRSDLAAWVAANRVQPRG
jgi:excisionase family DNA binding protein